MSEQVTQEIEIVGRRIILPEDTQQSFFERFGLSNRRMNPELIVFNPGQDEIAKTMGSLLSIAITDYTHYPDLQKRSFTFTSVVQYANGEPIPFIAVGTQTDVDSAVLAAGTNLAIQSVNTQLQTLQSPLQLPL